MGVLPMQNSVYHIRVWCLWRKEEDVESPETRVAQVANQNVHDETLIVVL